jgi:hypothetical protein
MSLTSSLFRLARASATGAAVVHGHTTRRVGNVVKGRVLARAGVWRLLWGGGRKRRKA